MAKKRRPFSGSRKSKRLLCSIVYVKKLKYRPHNFPLCFPFCQNPVAKETKKLFLFFAIPSKVFCHINKGNCWKATESKLLSPTNVFWGVSTSFKRKGFWQKNSILFSFFLGAIWFFGNKKGKKKTTSKFWRLLPWFHSFQLLFPQTTLKATMVTFLTGRW